VATVFGAFLATALGWRRSGEISVNIRFVYGGCRWKNISRLPEVIRIVRATVLVEDRRRVGVGPAGEMVAQRRAQAAILTGPLLVVRKRA